MEFAIRSSSTIMIGITAGLNNARRHCLVSVAPDRFANVDTVQSNFGRLIEPDESSEPNFHVETIPIDRIVTRSACGSFRA